jgi:GldM N-terminal domain
MNFYNKHIILSLVVLVVLFSCANHSSTSDEFLEDFDSVSKSLEKTNGRVSKSTNTLYAELEKKFGDNGGFGKIQQMRYYVQDFYGYISDIKFRFNIACGDKSTGLMMPEESTDDLSLTNNFFIENKHAETLVNQMKAVQKVLLLNVTDPSLKDEIERWMVIPVREKKYSFERAYFYNTPPVASISILNKFENDVKVFESKILTNYLKQ